MVVKINIKENRTKKRSQTFIEIENRILKVLYPMHNLIIEEEVFPEWMEIEAINCISANLRHEDATREEMNEYAKYNEIITIQLKCNDLRKLQKEEEEAREEIKKAERKLKKIISRELPDQQTSLTTS